MSGLARSEAFCDVIGSGVPFFPMNWLHFQLGPIEPNGAPSAPNGAFPVPFGSAGATLGSTRPRGPGGRRPLRIKPVDTKQ